MDKDSLEVEKCILLVFNNWDKGSSVFVFLVVLCDLFLFFYGKGMNIKKKFGENKVLNLEYFFNFDGLVSVFKIYLEIFLSMLWRDKKKIFF